MKEILEAWLTTLDAVKTIEITDSAETYNSRSWKIHYSRGGIEYKITIEEQGGVTQEEDWEDYREAVTRPHSAMMEALRTMSKDEVDTILKELKRSQWNRS